MLRYHGYYTGHITRSKYFSYGGNNGGNWTRTHVRNGKVNNLAEMVSPIGISFVKSIIFWDMTPCSLLNLNGLHNHRCENLKS
jgi:hypothetical protein